MEHFTRLYQGDNGRLMVTDARGRTAAHLAAAKNRVNILQFIYAQQGSEYLNLLYLNNLIDGNFMTISKGKTLSA